MAVAAHPGVDFFITVNDHCIDEILEWLPLDDLCEFSRTCKRIQALCEHHFRRKYPYEVNRQVRLSVGRDGNFTVHKVRNYMKYFNNFMKNVCITTSPFSLHIVDPARIGKLLRAKCDQNLYRIEIITLADLVPFYEEMKDVLRNVRVVDFFTGRNVQLRENFLTYCPNVGVSSSDVLPLKKFQRLTNFHLNGDTSDFNEEKLKIFFQTNTTIKAVRWKVSVMSKEKNPVPLIKNLHYALNLEHFSFEFPPLSLDGRNRICSYLKLLCDRANFKTLDIKFRSGEGAEIINSCAKQLANLKQFTKICLLRIHFSDVLPALKSFVQLRVIVVGCFNIVNPSDVFPQIEEIHFDNRLSIYCYNEFVTFSIRQLVRHWRYLKRILVTLNEEHYPLESLEEKYRQFFQTFDLVKLNRERELLENACELNILASGGNFTVNNSDHKLVKIKKNSGIPAPHWDD